MSDPRLAKIGDGGISDEAKAFALTLPDTLSYNARNMLADFVTRSDARATYIENWLGGIAQELIDAEYIVELEGMTVKSGGPVEPYTCYSYTDKLLELRE